MTDYIETAVFDLETTGIDTDTARIVTAYVGLLDSAGNVVREQEWIVDPGADHEDDLAAAAQVHGWTRDRLNADPRTRRDYDAAVLEIAHLLWAIGNPESTSWRPIAGHNLAYDFTVLKSNLGRAGTTMFPFGQHGIRALDSYVLDKHYDKWVKGTGQRKLTPTAARYGIQLTEEQAHDASFDAIAAGRICQAIVATRANGVDLLHLHQQQVTWRAEQQRGLQTWLRKPNGGNDPQAVCETGWPVH